ncbi:MAG: DUF4129 domain-containing protein [Alphaproteobacteria bacterium]|nr:DUF4129 domain-containing protein [Alphaproteobacteria bacterium]
MTFAALLMTVCAAPAAPAAEASSAIDEASKRALSDRDIQKTLPGLTGGARRRPPPDPRGTEPPRRQPIPQLPERSASSGLGGIGKTVLWVIAIVAGLALLYFLLREVWSFRLGSGRKRFEKTEVVTHAGDGEAGDDARPDSLLDEADRLAARGAFAEAVHLILMHSLGRLESVGKRAIGRSLTAREILRGSSSITARARDFLGAIVGASELAHFGGRPADAETYQSCRQAFQNFAAETGERP